MPLGTGYTAHVLPSSSAWACRVQVCADKLGLLWASPSSARWYHMLSVPSALDVGIDARVASLMAGEPLEREHSPFTLLHTSHIYALQGRL